MNIKTHGSESRGQEKKAGAMTTESILHVATLSKKRINKTNLPQPKIAS